jgi:Fe-S-cluster containining protein
VHVEAAPAEIDAVAAHLVAVRTPVEIDGLLAALPRGVGLTPDERWAKRIPCALLGQDGGCSIHPVRPLRCRAFHSCDAGRCRSAFSGDSDDEPVRNDALSRAYDAAEAGLRAALEDKGITAAPELFELGLLRRLGAR